MDDHLWCQLQFKDHAASTVLALGCHITGSWGTQPERGRTFLSTIPDADKMGLYKRMGLPYETFVLYSTLREAAYLIQSTYHLIKYILE